MKKSILSTFAFIFMCLTAGAQSITFDLKPEGKGATNDDAPLFIGCDDQRIVLIESTGLLSRTLSLAAYSLDQQELGRVELGKQKDLSAFGGYINGQHIDLIHAVFPNDAKTGQMFMRTYRNRHSLTTLQTEGDTMMLCKYDGEKGDWFGCGVVPSPDGKLLAGVYSANYKGQGSEVKVCLYSRELEEYWTMTAPGSFYGAVRVTDEGDVILYSFGDDGQCRFSILDGERIENAEFKLNTENRIIERELVRYGAGKIIVAAAVREEDHTIMPIGSNIDRVDIYCYDIAKKRLDVERHNFTDLEVNRLSNEKDGNKPRHHWVQFGQIAQTLADKDGGYVVIDQKWSVSVNGTPTEQHRRGMLVMRIDANGKILWTRTQRFSATARWLDRGLLAHRWSCTPDGIVLTWVDNAGNAALPAEKPFKEYKTGKSKTTLNVWMLTPSGDEMRGSTPVGTKCLIGGAHKLDKDGQYVALMRSGRKGQLAFITIEKR